MKLIAITIPLLLILFSCKKDEEDKTTQAPTINTVWINEVEVDESKEIEVDGHDDLTIDVKVSGDATLSQLSVEIHNAFDAHDHEHARLFSEEHDHQDTLSFGPQIFELSSNNETLTVYDHHLDSQYVSGVYHLELILLDSEANRTEKIIEFEIHEEHDEHEDHDEHEEHEEEEEHAH